MAPPTDLLQGTLDLLILKAISLGPLHGYGVLLRIQQVSRDKLPVLRWGAAVIMLLWAVMLGDLLSLELAAREETDPTPVAVIENLKDRLGRP